MSKWQVGDVISLVDGREFKIIDIERRPLARRLWRGWLYKTVFTGHAIVDGELQYDLHGNPATDEFSGLDIAPVIV